MLLIGAGLTLLAFAHSSTSVYSGVLGVHYSCPSITVSSNRTFLRYQCTALASSKRYGKRYEKMNFQHSSVSQIHYLYHQAIKAGSDHPVVVSELAALGYNQL